MEKPDISVDALGYEAAHLEYYFNLHAVNYNSSADKISKQSQLIIKKKYLDQKVEELIPKREKELYNIENYLLEPFLNQKEIDQFIPGETLKKLIGKHPEFSNDDLFILDGLVSRVSDLKTSDRKQFVFLKHPHVDFKSIISQFKEDNLLSYFSNVDWNFKEIEISIAQAIKFDRRINIYNVQRHGINRILIYVFREEMNGSNIPLWNHLDEEARIELIEDESLDYGFHQKNWEWIKKTFQTLKEGIYPKDEELNESKILDAIEDVPGHGLSDNRVAKQTKLFYKYKFGYSISVSHVKRINDLI